jgi:hypothetical protein
MTPLPVADGCDVNQLATEAAALAVKYADLLDRAAAHGARAVSCPPPT